MELNMLMIGHIVGAFLLLVIWDAVNSIKFKDDKVKRTAKHINFGLVHFVVAIILALLFGGAAGMHTGDPFMASSRPLPIDIHIPTAVHLLVFIGIMFLAHSIGDSLKDGWQNAKEKWAAKQAVEQTS